MYKLYLLVWWLDGQPRCLEFTDEHEAIERVKDFTPLMDKVYLYETDRDGGIKAVDTAGW